MIIPKYYEDLTVLHKNTMPNRAYYIPSSGRQTAGRDKSDRFVLLSGEWKFRYFDSIYQAKEAFYEEGFCTETFDTVTVPGVWQNDGYGRHQYTNIRYPFPFDPPYVPHDNPCGEYVRTFTYRKDEKAPNVYLNFEGVDSCFYVWLNGKFVGYSQVSHSTSEFDITSCLREGENTLAVLVLQWCDGSYMEDQDKFRMSGIFRDVYLLRRPENGIFDYFVKAIPSDDYKEGNVEISFQYRNQPVPVSVTLLDANGKKVAEGTVGGDAGENKAKEKLDGKFVSQGNVSLHIADANLWSAETPYLYTLILETENEVITDTVGIREIHTKDGVLYINGVKVKFHGTNRHDSDPVTGFVIGRQQIIKDLTLMKEHNMNAIRTSHYPNAPWFYQIFDRLGFYVIDEADNESHGTGEIYFPEMPWEERVKHWNETIADNPDFTEATVDRARRLVERDKNRPCVIMWSMGNECAFGCAFEEALKWTKEFDPTRLTHYESARYISDKRKYDYSNLDTHSRMYPSLKEMHDYFEQDGTKPFVLCEYCHAMGNGPGDLEDYFEVIHQYDGACGGFVWEWCDHAIDMGRSIEGKEMYAYGGDHKEFPHDGNFCMDGLVYPDRTPHNGLLEFKNVHRPARVIKFDQDNGKLVIRNYMDFVNLKDYLDIQYEVFVDGVAAERKKVEEKDIPDIFPHEEKEVPVVFEVPPKGKCYLKVTYLLRTATEVLPAGFVLGFEEVGIKTGENANQRVKALLTFHRFHGTVDGPQGQGSEMVQNGYNAGWQARFTIEEDDCSIVISNGVFSYTYDKLKGVIAQMVYNNEILLNCPMEYNIWRAPTDNDRNVKNEWMRAGYDRAVARAYQTTVKNEDDRVRIETVLSVSAIALQRILDIKACWTIYPNGAVELSLDGRKNMEFPFLPRFGLRLFLPKVMSRVTYCGIGPVESYIDKNKAGYHGLFTADVKAMHEDYIYPQENGSHHDCDFVELSGDRLCLTVAGTDTFAFNASVYTQEELAEKAHNYELEESPYTVLCIDYRQSGIGSNSCGPELLEKYRLNEEKFHYQVYLIPKKK